MDLANVPLEVLEMILSHLTDPVSQRRLAQVTTTGSHKHFQLAFTTTVSSLDVSLLLKLSQIPECSHMGGSRKLMKLSVVVVVDGCGDDSCENQI